MNTLQSQNKRNLPEYQSHKIVQAAEIKGIEFRDQNKSAIIATDHGIIETQPNFRERFKGNESDLGYYVLYADGYESWSPKVVFEQGYTKITTRDEEGELVENLSFSVALSALKNGRRITRKGWNGKGMFLFLLPANDGIPTSAIHDPALRQVIEEQVGGDTFDAYGSIRMWTADKKVLTGWLASQTDMLAEDWMIL